MKKTDQESCLDKVGRGGGGGGWMETEKTMCIINKGIIRR